MQKTIGGHESFRNFAIANERETALYYVGVLQLLMARFVGGAGFNKSVRGLKLSFRHSTLFLSNSYKTLNTKEHERKEVTEKSV